MKGPRYAVVEKSCCGTCVHYRQYYVLLEGGRPYPPLVRPLLHPQGKAPCPGRGLPSLGSLRAV